MAEALTQSDSNPINYNKMAEVNINRISYINLAGAETQSTELNLVFIEGRVNLHRILPLQPKKKIFFVTISPAMFREEHSVWPSEYLISLQR